MASAQSRNDSNSEPLASSLPSDSQHLPSAFFELPNASTANHESRSSRGLGDYIRRMRHLAQMDWELTMWQMVYLCVQPKKVYNTTKYHKQTKNQWARDDPGFVVLLVVLLIMAVVAWCTAFRSLGQIPKMILYVVGVDFLLVALVVATCNWWVCNRFMVVGSNAGPGSGANRGSTLSSASQSPFLVKQRVEWLYAFDVHCNSFFPAFLVLHVLQFLLLPVILNSHPFASTFVSNALFLFAFSYYYFITSLGFTALPFLTNTNLFMLPIPVLLLAFILALVFQFNTSIWFLTFYFPNTM